MLRRLIFALCLVFGSAHAENPPYRILGIGASCLDVLIQVDDEFLVRHVVAQKGGGSNVDANTFDRILNASSVAPKIAPGGSAANAIRGLAHLGEKCAFLSHRGEDSFGIRLSGHLQELGIVELLSVLPETARVLCLITPDGQRTFCGYDPQIDDLSIPLNYFKDVSLVHIEARRLNSSNYIEHVMQLAKKANCKISIDLSDFWTVSRHKETLQHLLANYVDIVFANEDEVEALTGLSPEEGCLKLQEICPISVVTLGPQGCLVGHKNNLIAVPTFPAKVLDTTGAGDLFACGFLYGYLHNYPLLTCARIGNLLGSSIVEVIGAELPQEKWVEIQSFLNDPSNLL